MVQKALDKNGSFWAELDRRAKEIERLRAALKEIVEIEDEQYGTDWCEIEKARDIANAALSHTSR